MLRNGLEPMHLLVLLITIMVLFGAKRLPDVAKSVGQSMKIFKNEVKDLREGDGGSDGGDTSTDGPGEPAPRG